MAAIVVMLVASGFAVLNFYLSFIRGRIKRDADKRHVSGVPIVGTVLVVVGAVVGFGSALIAGAGIVATALDTGGTVWFLASTWNDASLWDDPQDSGPRV